MIKLLITFTISCLLGFSSHHKKDEESICCEFNPKTGECRCWSYNGLCGHCKPIRI